jgi:hypothetical protein
LYAAQSRINLQENLMKAQFHREITTRALNAYFQPSALEIVIVANLGQDALRYQVGHDHFHYDANAFSAGDDYCAALRLAVLNNVHRADFTGARENLGRLTHTVQDLYAHSNYVALWREQHPVASPEEIEPELDELLQDPCIHSGKLYYPLEALAFITPLKPYIVPLLPRDSHAWMNIDDPSRPNFEYAFSAGVKRTASEYRRIIAQLSSGEIELLSGREI